MHEIDILTTIVHLYLNLCKRTVLYRAVRSYFNSHKGLMKQALTTKNNQSNYSKYVWRTFNLST